MKIDKTQTNRKKITFNLKLEMKEREGKSENTKMKLIARQLVKGGGGVRCTT